VKTPQVLFSGFRWNWWYSELFLIEIINLGFHFTEDFGLCQLDYYHYLSYGGTHKVEGTNDAHDFQETLKGKW
jgi:hypothetical protein